MEMETQRPGRLGNGHADVDDMGARLALLAARPMGRAQFLAVGLCFLLNMLDGVDILLMSYAAPVIADEWATTPVALGLVFSAGLVGMGLGSILLAPLGDIAGRRKLLLASTVIIAAGMFGAATARGVFDLIAWRVLTGLGIGAILATMAAVTSEFSNARRRALCVAVLQAGYPIGATLTGFVAAELLPEHGWRPLFVGAGVLSVAFLPLILVMLPESLEFLAARGGPDRLARLNAVLGRLDLPRLEREPPLRRAAETASLRSLLRGRLVRPTLALWGAFAGGVATLYFLLSWIPKIAVDAGLRLEDAIYAGAAFNAGACVGTVLIGWAATHVPLRKLVSFFLVAASLTMVAFGATHVGLAPTFALILLLGVTVQGGFNGLYPLAAAMYPAEVRATGVGWAIGVGRVGAILGPLAGGYLIAAGTARPVLFLALCAPLVVAAIAVRWTTSSAPQTAARPVLQNSP